MAILRTPLQKKILEEMSAFWAKGSSLGEPYKIECIRGSLYVRFCCSSDKARTRNLSLGVLLDWCQDRNIKFTIHHIHETTMGWSKRRTKFARLVSYYLCSILIKREE